MKHKNIKYFSMVISIVFISMGLIIQVYCRFGNNNGDKSKIKDQEIVDILNAETTEELKKIADETEVELQYDNDTIFTKGYSFGIYPVEITVNLNDENNINYFDGTIFIDALPKDYPVQDFKKLSDEIFKVFVERFNIGLDKIQILNSKSMASLDINSINSYKEVVERNADISLFVKDENGFIWILRTTGTEDVFYGFQLLKIIDKDRTKYMHFDVDLSQAATKAQGQ